MRKNVTLSSKGQVVIPASVRRSARLRPGDRLEVTYQAGAVVMKKSSGLHDLEALAMAARVYFKDRNLEQELLRERAHDYAREKKNRP